MSKKVFFTCSKGHTEVTWYVAGPCPLCDNAQHAQRAIDESNKRAMEISELKGKIEALLDHVAPEVRAIYESAFPANRAVLKVLKQPLYDQEILPPGTKFRAVDYFQRPKKKRRKP